MEELESLHVTREREETAGGGSVRKRRVGVRLFLSRSLLLRAHGTITSQLRTLAMYRTTVAGIGLALGKCIYKATLLVGGREERRRGIGTTRRAAATWSLCRDGRTDT